MTNTTENSTPDLEAAASLRADDAAMATDCGFPDCEGIGHDACTAPEKWGHRLGHSSFDAVNVEFHRFGSNFPIAVVDMHVDAEMTAAELRADADLYEAYPAWLRARADELDTLTKNATVNR
jgi:hypothetical protein